MSQSELSALSLKDVYLIKRERLQTKAQTQLQRDTGEVRFPIVVTCRSSGTAIGRDVQAPGCLIALKRGDWRELDSDRSLSIL